MFRLIASAMLFVFFAVNMSAHAADEPKYTISQLMAMEGKVVSANEKYVWIWIESRRTSIHQFFVCRYNVESPTGKSVCAEIK